MADKTAEQPPVLSEIDINIATSQLSAIIDEELEEREIDLVLRRLIRDQDARDCWERYHLISHALQGHLPDAFDTGFAARIRQAIASEQPLQPAAKPLPAWYKPVAGFGLAASVVLVAWYGLNLTETDNTFPAAATTSFATVMSAAPPAASSARQGMVSSQPRHNPQDPLGSRLNNYLANHNSYASLSSVNGAASYARMVGYQPNR
ncbi:MAG: sigma-E factor negative regulatory protein [Candidatus Competibacteraceae bacterium]|nr:sigma-E factor negative regulatory protein [Candidatus Competibacteraceae bacterium]